MLVYENIKHLPPKEQQDFIWDKIIYANPTKPKETLDRPRPYKPLVTYDNLTNSGRSAVRPPRRRRPPPPRPQHRLMVELSSKFGCDPGEAVDLIVEAFGWTSWSRASASTSAASAPTSRTSSRP
jgi:ornithine decarboxylase